jgi:hypothetical protein
MEPSTKGPAAQWFCSVTSELASTATAPAAPFSWAVTLSVVVTPYGRGIFDPSRRPDGHADRIAFLGPEDFFVLEKNTG